MSYAVRSRLASTVPASLPGLLLDRTNALAETFQQLSLGVARSAAQRVAATWWHMLVAINASHAISLQVPAYDGPVMQLPPEVIKIADAIGANMAALPVPLASAELGRLYSGLLPPAHRTSNGVFYTPAPLVSRLLNNAETAGHDWTLGKVIDPSCGGGAFLQEAAIRIKRALGPTDPRVLIAAIGARLRGWDIDPFAAWLAQLSIEAVLLPDVIASGKRLTRVTETRDSLADWTADEGTYALVMGNPAFGKLKDTDDIRRRFRRSLFGHPNLYGLFTDLAIHLASPRNGVIAYLTPTSYLGGQYFKSLRRLLAHEAPPVSIDIVESRKDVFDEVLQEVALSVFQRSKRRARTACSVIHVEPQGLRVEPAGTLTLPAPPEQAWVMPRSLADAPFVDRMRSMPHRLASWGYSVSTGPLVWNRMKDRLHNDTRPDSVPVVWAEAVCPFGRFRLRPEKRNHAACYQPTGPSDPNLIRTPCLLMQRTTSKEQTRRLISALLPASVIETHGAVAVENHLNMVLPKVAEPAIPLATLAAFFASQTADRVIRCINASVAVSASEIEAMPLPPADSVIEAMAETDPEAGLRRLYGIAE